MGNKEKTRKNVIWIIGDQLRSQALSCNGDSNVSGVKVTSGNPIPGQDSVFLQSVTPNGHGDNIDKPWCGVITNEVWQYVCLTNVDWMMFD